MIRQRSGKPKPEIDTSFRDVVQPHVWLLDGHEAGSGNPLRILYVGSQKQKDYIAFLAFCEGHQDRYIGRRDLLTLYGLVRRNTFHCALIVIEGHFGRRKLFEEPQDYYVPLWLEGESELPMVARTKSAKEELRRIKKSALTFAVTRDPGDLSRFYHDMYVPYVLKRHEERAVLLRYEQMIKLAQEGRCELLWVKKGDEAIAGGLNLLGTPLPKGRQDSALPKGWQDSALPRGRRDCASCLDRIGEGLPRRWADGVKDGNLSYWKDGAMAATNYFSSLRLRELGYQRMHMGLSRAFLNDGVLQYKRKWGMRITRPFPIGFLLKFRELTAGLRGFLTGNPFAYLYHGQLQGAVFVEDQGKLSDRALEHMRRLYFLPGLSQVHVHLCTDQGLSGIAILDSPAEPDTSLSAGGCTILRGDGPR